MEHTKDFCHKEAIKKIKELVKDITTCMFCTKIAGRLFQTRPIASLDVDDEGIYGS